MNTATGIVVRTTAFVVLGTVAVQGFGEIVDGERDEQGRREREAALQSAVQEGPNQSYGELTDSALKGRVTQGAKYIDPSTNQECIDVEEMLEYSLNP